jgi:predicted Fe-S protein YdhL (DUF1289 family)
MCKGCAVRREWISKWSKVAYERAQRVLSQSADQFRVDEGGSRPGAGVSDDLQAAAPGADEDQRC